MQKHALAALVAATMSIASGVHAANLTGAGGTAIYPLLSDWADTYAKQTGVDINYQEVGSGAGIQQIESKTVLFANTDMPLTPNILAEKNLVQFPQHPSYSKPTVPSAKWNMPTSYRIT